MNFINIAYSGAQAAQAQLQAVAMNTANAQTPGYSRQRAELSALSIGATSRIKAGDGVIVEGIRRIANQNVVNQLWQATSKNGYQSISQQFLTSLEAIIVGKNNGIDATLDTFFSSLNEATTQPDSRALRQQIINEANALSVRLNNINNTISSQKVAIHNQRAATITSVNTLASNIAEINKKISQLDATGANANVLRDQRDELINELSEHVEIRITEARDGSINITFKNGQPLVSGSTAATISTQNTEKGDQILMIDFANSQFELEMETGGKLGAFYDYEVNHLNKTKETIESLAKNLADIFNQQLSEGYDLNGNPGKPLFVFDPSNPNGMLQVNSLTPDELAFSSSPDETGNGKNLQLLADLRSKPITITHLGETTLNDAGATIVSEIGIATRRSKDEAKSAASILHETQLQRDSISAVNLDEEALNLIQFSKQYQSNLKVMSTGDELFNALLSAF